MQKETKITVKDSVFGEERALYALTNAEVLNCSFKGEEDGESALKECRNITLYTCGFFLRYPLWHGTDLRLKNCSFSDSCRAAFWYDENTFLEECKLLGIKAFRECKNTVIKNCEINSPEFGWNCRSFRLLDSEISAEYLFLNGKIITLDNVKMNGKYSFQYVKNAVIKNSVLNTKDAFWHAKNVTVENCEVKGEYLGWYSENLTFINCKISGTQPLCYCKKLRLINCETEGCDLAFEYSDVNAQITGHIDSVKNPRSGKIVADSIGETILENSVIKTRCSIITNSKN